MKNLYKVYDSDRERESLPEAISMTQKLQCQILLQKGLKTITPLLGSNSLLFFSGNPWEIHLTFTNWKKLQ